jgi:ADP-ribose pyrophosphatase YjhB (NUDIX family)
METKKTGAGVGVLLLKDGEVLLGKRNDDEQKADSVFHGGGTWTMPGGKLEFHENFEDCGVREVKEETGMKVKEIKVICVNNDKTDSAHFITIGLLAEKFEGEPKITEPNEITEWKWFGLNSLPKNLYFPTAKILENYKQGRFYLKK